MIRLVRMVRSTRSSGLALLLSSLALISFAGCGNGNKIVYKVRGQVFDAKKQPAVGAMVTFHPTVPDPKDPARPTGTVDEQGNYTLTTYLTGDGAPEGDYVITIVWPPARKTPFEPIGKDLLNGKFDRPEKSPHKFTVDKKVEQEVPPISLP